MLGNWNKPRATARRCIWPSDSPEFFFPSMVFVLFSSSSTKVSVPVVVGVVPGWVHLAPFAVDLYGVPGVAVSGDAAVGDARGVKELGVDALVALAGALVAREAAFGRAPVEAVVVLQMVKSPVVQPQGAGVVGPVGIGAAFVDCGLHDGADRRIGVVVRARKHV